MFEANKLPYPNIYRAITGVLEKVESAQHSAIMDGGNETLSLSLTEQERQIIIDALKHYQPHQKDEL